ncbi:MAG: hypothetical protein ACRC6N_13325, partial [Plesiomonas sp.]|uniref:hypothetical protein n=1 Tax=Plesiomonas sp. TaxID=2486279 RepID=UPI003F3BCC28
PPIKNKSTQLKPHREAQCLDEAKHRPKAEHRTAKTEHAEYPPKKKKARDPNFLFSRHRREGY